MYEELVKTLRCCGSENQCKGCPRENEKGKCYDEICIEAADAIEELSRENESLAKSVNEASEILRRRWIPVAERLPEDCTDVLAYIERNAWGDGDAPHRKREIAIGYHVNGLWHVDGCSRVDCISWQALPEPPKDGES